MNIKEIKIAVNYKKGVQYSECTHINSTYSAGQIFKKIFASDEIEWLDEYVILCMDHIGDVVGFYKVAKGYNDIELVDVRMISLIAVSTGSTRIIVAHKVSSNAIEPDAVAIKHSERINQAMELLGIRLLDHMIVNNNGDVYSYRDNEML